jgi:hypothetical protein
MRTASRSRRWILAAVAAAGLLAASRPAAAQATMDAQVGLNGYYKAERWLPVQVILQNQGQPARVEVVGRFSASNGWVQEYRVPTRELPSNANQLHTLYIKAPTSYSAEPLTLELFKDGRRINQVKPQFRIVNPGDWLVLGIGNAESVKALTASTLGPSQVAPGAGAAYGGNPQPKVMVATTDPSRAPDRWQGIEAVDMVVLSDVTERDFTPQQLTALRDYAISGGTLVVTGGVNWNRLTTPFFSELLPVKVTGTRTTSSLPSLSAMAGQPAPSGTPFALSTSAAKPDAAIKAVDNGSPLVAVGRKGAGRVVFVAFDPSLPPFKTWDGTREFWKRLLLDQEHKRELMPAFAASEEQALVNAPFAISQLDIPAFYQVALFLLAYIIVLVPVNYYFLKAWDKKEYAWLTTPAIVAVFSVGAYLLAYGFKGGRTLVVKVAVIEAHNRQPAAPMVAYAGVFSPKKTAYDVAVASDDPRGRATAGSTLLSEPARDENGNRAPLRVVQDDGQKIDDFAVDMWAMRVLKAHGVVDLGGGVTGTWVRDGNRMTGTVRNDSPFTLTDCHVVIGPSTIAVEDLPPGKQVRFTSDGPVSATGGTALPLLLRDKATGGREERRVKQALYSALSAGSITQQGTTWIMPREPVLIGWVKEDGMRLTVDGRPPRTQNATLFVLHMSGNQRPS